MADVLGFLKKGFPYIAAGLSLAGPPGNLAASIVGKVLNVDNPTPDSVAKALSSLTLTPDQQIALQQAEQQYKAQMQQMGYQTIEDLEQIAALDRQSARDMEVKTGDKWTPRILAGCVIGAWIITQCYLIPHAFAATKTPDATMVGMLNRVLGTLDAALTLVLGFYFGSSAGSAEKNAVLAQIAKQT